uniref:Alpha-2-macroglobulin bait region domain-containing protein n=1 Tax=Oreochromis aureus TaxID=47969 RepID=A0A668VFC4_OREAU
MCSSVCVCRQYLVAIPAVIEAGAESKFCASLLQPGETVVMTVTLMSREENTTLLTHTSNEEFHTCTQFKAPSVEGEKILDFEVEVRGDTFHAKEVRKVMIKAYKARTFIQTDKPLYLPGQTVHFRVVALDSKFRPVSQLVSVSDPNNNRIGQWLNETSNNKILQLSYSLNSEAPEGTYQIIVSVDANFDILSPVLPKFDVTVNVSEEVSIGQEDVDIKLCAKYTFGQPVPGSVTITMCRPLHYSQRKVTEILLETELNKTGCTVVTFKMSTFKKTNKKFLQDELIVSAKMEEEGTGKSCKKRIRISYMLGKVYFVDMPRIYEPGSNVEGKVSSKFYYNDTPISKAPVYLFVEEYGSAHLLKILTTDSNGVAEFSFSTDNFDEDIKLHVSNYTETVTVTSQPHVQDAKTFSSLEVKMKDKILSCDAEEDISIRYTIVREAVISMDVMYLVSYFLRCIYWLFLVFLFVSVNEGEVSFKLRISPDMAPVVQIVAYAVLPRKIVIAHSADFSTEKCFSNKVSLEFTPSSAVPGEKNNMQVTALPHSLCGVSAIDKSVLIEEPGNILDVDKVTVVSATACILYSQNFVKSLFSFLFKLQIIKTLAKSKKNVTASSLFRLSIYSLFVCFFNHSTVFGSPGNPGISHSPEAPLMKTVRTFFPETWIWDLVEVGESGTKDVSLTVPDTITTWETEAFCLSSQGFGLAPRKEFRVFQPFFLELTMPYSIIRGEHFELKATVFNYLTSCIMVAVFATPSSDYTLTPLSGDQYTSCLCASERKTVSWTMIPTVLGAVNVTVSAEAVPSHVSCDNEVVSVPERGRIDVVTKSFIVKAEGTEMTKTSNWLLCPKGQFLIYLQFKCAKVVCDILGRALKNLDGLLQMPYGCGEQNMALLAPNIYILQYLKGTQQLTPAIMEKATNFLNRGYQRQLNYKSYKGAYTIFGRGPGNTWLTAFVMRSFAKAQSFVYIDPRIIEESKTWLGNKQQANGCFKKSGKLFHNRMKGGVSDEVTLSAYITAAFLEMNISQHDPVVNNSLACLRESINDLSNTYTTALLAYVFTLAGDTETRAHLLQHLDTVAVREGGFLYWSQTAAETSASLSVEISSYVLLAKLSASTAADDLGYASGIIRWLTGQQNYYGGFSSTQDTVVALQALALYSTLVFSPEGSSTVTVQSDSSQLTFDVNPGNKLLYQEETMEGVSGKYSLEVKGTACVSVQVSDSIVTTPTDVTTLSVEVKSEIDATSESRRNLTLTIKSLYSGKENTTNMVILDIKMLSGFENVVSSQLKGAPLVDRVEQTEDHVLVYLQELPKDMPKNYSLTIIEELRVENLKPAVIKIYDYYQPSDRAETEYIYPSAAGNKLL